jgi:Raf kinase inhibitor-like YbhB/YbcL family protein
MMVRPRPSRDHRGTIIEVQLSSFSPRLQESSVRESPRWEYVCSDGPPFEQGCFSGGRSAFGAIHPPRANCAFEVLSWCFPGSQFWHLRGVMSPELRQSETRKITRWMRSLFVAAPLCLLVVAVACHREDDIAQKPRHPAIELQSSGFANGGVIPQRYTCDGAGVSPDLHWSPAPNATKSLALVMHDPDAFFDFTHWIVFNIPPGAGSLPEGASGRSSAQSSLPAGSSEGTNDFGRPGYGGPCPPGVKSHRYVFHLYALDTPLDVPPEAGRKQFDSAIRGHILAEGRITGTYRRGNQ